MKFWTTPLTALGVVAWCGACGSGNADDPSLTPPAPIVSGASRGRLSLPARGTSESDLTISRNATGALELAALRTAHRRPIELSLGDTVQAWTRLRDNRSNVTLAFHLDAEASAPGAPEGDVLDYSPGPGSSVHAAIRAHLLGVEDFVGLAARGSAPIVSYRVSLSNAPRVRVGRGIIEYLDSAGHPRFRTSHPWVQDATGLRREAALQISGCVPPSSARSDVQVELAVSTSECEVVVSWDDSELVYPVLVDPPWESAGLLVEGRVFHTATLMDDGKVVVTGGYGKNGAPLKTVEERDPSSGMWEYAMGELDEARAFHTATLLSADRVLVVGGYGDSGMALDSAELGVNGSWGGNVTHLQYARVGHTATAVSDQKVVIIGGGSAEVELFDGATLAGNPWSTKKPTNVALYGHTATALSNGSILVTGGSEQAFPFPYGTWRSDVRTYDSKHDYWFDEPSMSAARAGHSATLLSKDRVIVIGAAKGAESFDGQTWTSVADPPSTRQFHTAVVLSGPGSGQERVVVSGGVVGDVSQRSTNLYDLATDGWQTFPFQLDKPRFGHTMTVLGGDDMLVAGGRIAFGTALQEVEQVAIFPIGHACADNGDCASGFCADGVCCKTLCSGGCEACSEAAGSGHDGDCDPLDLGQECRTAQPKCMAAICDGKGRVCPQALPVRDGRTCDDGDDATQRDHCVAGVCTGSDAGAGGEAGAAGGGGEGNQSGAGGHPAGGDSQGGGGADPSLGHKNPYSCSFGSAHPNGRPGVPTAALLLLAMVARRRARGSSQAGAR